MKKILVAGSSSGIGKAIAEILLQNNYHVIGLARNHQKFQPNSPNYIPYAVDFSEISKIEAQLKNIQKLHSVEALVCCVGYGEFKELEQFSVQQMQAMLNVNFLSQAILIKTFLPMLKQKQAGKIIVIGSECALEGQKKASMYCAAKFALRGFTQSLRKECASSQVSLTLINPGLVDTPFFDDLNFRPAKGEIHTIQPQQIASLVAMIVDEKHNCVYEEINLQPMTSAIIKVPNFEKFS